MVLFQKFPSDNELLPQPQKGSRAACSGSCSCSCCPPPPLPLLHAASAPAAAQVSGFAPTFTCIVTRHNEAESQPADLKPLALRIA